MLIKIRPISITLNKTQIQVDQRRQNKTSYTEPDRRKVGNSTERICMEDNILNRTLIAQTLRQSIGQNCSLWNRKRYLPMQINMTLRFHLTLSE